MHLRGGIFYRQQNEGNERDAGHAIGFKSVRGRAHGIAGVVAGAVRNHAGVARIVFLDLENNFHQVGADVGNFGEDAAGDAQRGGAERFADGEADKARPGVIAGNEQQNNQHHQQLDTDEHHAYAHSRFQRNVVDGIGLAAQTGERRARIRESVHANAKPGNAVTAAHAHQAEKQNNRQGDGNGFARNGSEHAEIQHDDNRYKNPEQEKELALRREIGFAGFVNQFGDIAHRFVNRQVFQPRINHQPERETKQTEKNAEEQESMTIRAEKFHLREVGELQTGFAAGFFRILRECGSGGEERKNGGRSNLAESKTRGPGTR